MTDRNQYRSIFKATTIFGGTQVFQILFTLLRSKCVALLIGVTGMGITTMYNTSLALIITIFGMGINVSIVNRLTKAYDEGDHERIAVITSVFRRLVIFLSVAGGITVVFLSPLLSKWSFGDTHEMLHYCFLSFMVIATLLQQGYTAILVSLRRIKDVAMASLLSSLSTLVLSVPFFYFLGTDGIVPGMVFSSVASFLIPFFFVRRLHIPDKKLSRRVFQTYSRNIMLLGTAMVFSQLMGNVSVYIVNVSIFSLGGIEDIGMYSAAMGVVTYSCTLVFSSMASDYYPRLLTSLKDRALMSATINQQTEIILLIVAPLLTAMIFFTPLLIRVLLTEKFLVITPLVRILCVGMLLKSVSYALGYVSLSHNEKRIYTCTEGIYSNIATAVLSIFMYYFYGLEGLGYAVLIDYTLYYIIIFSIDRFRYGYRIERGVVVLFGESVAAMMLMVLLTLYLSGTLYYLLGALLLAALSMHYLFLLKKRVGKGV